MKKLTLFATTCLSVITLVTAAVPANVLVGAFSSSDTQGWESKSFAGTTQYNIVKGDEATYLRASSDNTASAFYRKVTVDLKQTPFLNWSWQKLNTLDPGDENTKTGDDFVARVYVVKDGGLFVWNTKALNYVWSYSHQAGDSWDNPFAGDKARMIAVRDEQHGEQEWFSEKRNVVEDFKQQFGLDIDENRWNCDYDGY